MVYEICDGLDAQLITNLEDYDNCLPQWEYSFDLTHWTDLGRTNTVQNTNILPADEWPDSTATSIFYRVSGPTAQEPSACTTCQSNLVEIRIAPPPETIEVDGIFAFCENFTNTLTITNPMPDLTYTWFCDNVEVATGTTYTYYADESKDFKIKAEDACLIITNRRFAVDFCDFTAVVTCPLLPNDCACLGEPITVWARGLSKCENENYSYQWTIDGLVQHEDSPYITFIPKADGSVYQAEIVDLVNGCIDVAEGRITPCDKQ